MQIRIKEKDINHNFKQVVTKFRQNPKKKPTHETSYKNKILFYNIV